MMKKTVKLLPLILMLGSCTLLKPSLVNFENLSDYSLHLTIKGRDSRELVIEPGKGEFILTPPGELECRIEIEPLGFSKDYRIKVSYLESSHFIFRTKP